MTPINPKRVRDGAFQLTQTTYEFLFKRIHLNKSNF